MNLYHYTTGAHIARIVESGYLKLTPSPERLHQGERPLVWLTTDTDIPPTALKPMRLGEQIHYPTVDELTLYAGVYRFTMPSGLKVADWKKAMKRYGADSALADVAERMGEDSRTWRVSTKRIKIAGLRLEVRQTTSGEYVSIDSDDWSRLGNNVQVEKY